MININIHKENNNIKKIIIIGHSNYDVAGKDIVCAGVSSTVLTTVNAIISINEQAISYEEKKDLVTIIINIHDEVIDKLLNNMLKMLESLEKDYTKYIKINKEV
ncbi:MAG: ribosomal-processing cysteine protease Prp [Bacilli bacterium]|nr:ribosomal-processing cysteine protease Prp [Bacilli bacterium]